MQDLWILIIENVLCFLNLRFLLQGSLPSLLPYESASTAEVNKSKKELFEHQWVYGEFTALVKTSELTQAFKLLLFTCAQDLQCN